MPRTPAIRSTRAGKWDSHPAFQAAVDQVFTGLEQPTGYTEPLLHVWRRRVKEGAWGSP